MILELGPGENKKIEDAVGVDLLPGQNVDVVSDAFEYLQKLPDESLEEVHAYHFLAHIADIHAFLSLVARKLRASGRLVMTVPHFTNPYQWSDPTHVHRFGLYSFAYFVEEETFWRKVPRYRVIDGIKMTRCELVFKAERPFYIRYMVGRIFTLAARRFPILAEIYESYLTRVISCYEILIEFEKKTDIDLEKNADE